MKTKDIKAGSFYTLKTGETVRVEAWSEVPGWVKCWERDSQESFAVSVRQIKAEVSL